MRFHSRPNKIEITRRMKKFDLLKIKIINDYKNKMKKIEFSLIKINYIEFINGVM